MTKIVSALNAMIRNEEKISDVIAGEQDEIFFLYDGKYKWSMKTGDDEELWLWFYPGQNSLEDLSCRTDFEGVPMVTYRLSEIGTREATQTFRELYSIVREKMWGMDDILNDIIKDDDIPF